MGTELLFFFSLIGVFNTLCVAGFLLFKSFKVPSYFWISIFLFLVSIRAGVSCFYFFDSSVSPVIIQSGLIANALSGVVLYLYLRSRDENRKRDWWILATVATPLLILSIFYPMHSNFALWDHRIRFVMHGILGAFLLASWISAWKEKSNTSRLEWIVLIAFTLVCGGFAISLFTNYILGPIIYSCLFYGCILVLFINRSKQTRYADKKIDQGKANELFHRLSMMVTEEELYKNQKLKVNDLADRLDMPAHRISQLLNDNLDSSFASFVNKYRIEEAKSILLSESPLSIEGIGLEAGFGSKSTFFKVFKAEVGMTPAQYIKNNS